VWIKLQLKTERFSEVLDGRDVTESIRESLLYEPLERLTLNSDEVRQLEDIVEVPERIAVTNGGARGQSHSSGRRCETALGAEI
jgi:hypothetical protein